MNRTKAILVFAALLALTAVLVARGGGSSTPVPAPKPPVSSSGPVKLGAGLSGSHLFLGSDGQVYLDISLDVARQARPARTPVSVALVIDRSGSMAGEKLRHAQAAARRLVSSLNEGDRLALITYGSDVTTPVRSTAITRQSRRRILAAIDEISDRGGTYLSGGFEAGRDALLEAGGRAGHLRRIILISDGQANEGITSAGRLAAMARSALSRGVHLTTMGVGLDFNENLMTAMAEHGGGHYYFIEDAEALASIFAKELETLTSAVASGATLRITLAPGVELTTLYGHAHQQSGRVITVKLPDLYGGQKQMVMCKLKAPTSSQGVRELAQITLAYADVKNGEQVTLSSLASVAITPDRAAVAAGRDRQVLARAEQANVSANLTRAMDAFASGDVNTARTDLRNQIAVTTEANEDLKSGALKRILGKLRRQLKTAEEAAPSSAAGRALTKDGKYDAYKLSR